MVASTYINGNLVYYKKGDWYYYDDCLVFNNPRPCPKCGKLPTSEGYDACLGYIEGAIQACCGHGITNSYIWRREMDYCPLCHSKKDSQLLICPDCLKKLLKQINDIHIINPIKQ